MHRDRSNERQMRGPRRRDIGHDLLAERAAEWGGGAWRGGGGHRRMRRGDIRTSLLVALGDGPAHGYELITRLEEKSGGAWRPSPGSVYPTLQLFEDEGLVHSEERDGKRVYSLTDAGRTEAAERVERYGATPWEPGPDGEEGIRALFKALAQLAGATRQLRGADAAQVERATTVVRNASKELYQILSED
jgi:DNA-binding PadR family transcriptional regulator